MQARLAAKDIACRRGERLLFAGLSFELGAGEALQLRGANGTGKTSLIRILAGLTRPLDGRVERAGTIGLVDERLALDEHVPLGEALQFWERLDRAGNTSSAHAAMELGELLDVPVRYLSTGQRKRAALARLLNAGRAIWLLDEPLNGLDGNARLRVEQQIMQHCGGGGICVVASHQPIALPPNSETIVLESFAP